MTKVGVVQLSIMTVLLQQPVVTAFFDDGSLLHDYDAVRGFDGGKTMRDQNAGGILEDQIQCLLNLPFCERINAGSGFIENKDGGVLHQHAHP